MSRRYVVEGRVVTDEMIDSAIAVDRSVALEENGRKSLNMSIRERWLEKRFALTDRSVLLTSRECVAHVRRRSCESWLHGGGERFYRQIDHDIRMWDLEQARKLGVRSVLEDDLRDERLERERRMVLARDFARRGML